MSSVGHLFDVKHDSDGLCFICDIDCSESRAFKPYKPFKRFSGGFGVKLLLVMFGLAAGAVCGFNVALMIWL